MCGPAAAVCFQNSVTPMERGCIPPCFSRNENQSKAHSYSCTDYQVCARKGRCNSRQPISGQENISAAPVWWRKMSKEEKSKQERAVCPKESQVCNWWLGRFSGQRDILTAAWSSSLHCETTVFVDCRPTFPHSLEGAPSKDQGGILIWWICGAGASQCGCRGTHTDEVSCEDC